LRYVISYDLNRPGADYEALYDALSSVGAQRMLPSQWIVRWNNTRAESIRSFFQRHIAPNDRLVVSSLDSADWSGYNLMLDPNSI
jgi:hypothetical protein